MFSDDSLSGHFGKVDIRFELRAVPDRPEPKGSARLGDRLRCGKRDFKVSGKVLGKGNWNALWCFLILIVGLFRDENADLLRTKEFLIHDHEMVVKENERLTKKLETLER